MSIELFQRIATEHAQITGWCPAQKAFDLAAAVIALRPQIVVELGVWGGKSLIPMALACEAVGTGHVIAVDPWAAKESVVGYDAVNADWWGQQDHESVYRSFVGHVERLGLTNRIKIDRTTSDRASVPHPIDLLHVDGQHSEQAAKDVNRFAPNVRYGGIVCMDDIGWTVDGVPHVAVAVKRLLSLGFTELFQTKIDGVGHWGLFQKTHAATAKR
jgi:predicted O-methyltransferase YrrM